MEDRERRARLQTLRVNMNETVVRIRRYTVDPRLSIQSEAGSELRARIEAVWNEWLTLHTTIERIEGDPDTPALVDLEAKHLDIDHKTDLVQRELISDQSARSGYWTVTWLAAVLAAVATVYVWTHLVHATDLYTWDFEPWSEWGPLKYGEVAFWGLMGCLCYLVITAAIYVLRRDFDPWYRGWYVAVAIRSPFVTCLLMMMVLEFVEWYGEDGSWLRAYILEEGNKYYFMVFTSFCLGLASNSASELARELSGGVVDMVSAVVRRITGRLKGAIDASGNTTKH